MYLLEIYLDEKKVTIEVDISAFLFKGGPGIFVKGIYDILPYKTKNCNFIPSNGINPSIGKNKLYFFPIPKFNEQIYNKLINLKIVNYLL